MYDIEILKSLFTDSFYKRYSERVATNTLTKEGYEIFSSLKKYRALHPDQDISVDELTSYFLMVCHPDYTPKTVEVYRAVFKSIDECIAPASEELIEKYIEGETQQRIEESLTKGFDIHELLNILEEHKEMSSKKEADEFIMNDIQNAYKGVDRERGLPWRLECLNQNIGKLTRGDFILVAGYVDSGKTLFASSEITYMAQSLSEGTVLWLNNEQSDHEVLTRIWGSALMGTKKRILEDPELAKVTYTWKMGGDVNRIKIINIRNKSLEDVKSIFYKYKPKLAVIDQIDGIKTSATSGERADITLQKLYADIRILANTYCPIVGITQTDASVTWFNYAQQETKYQRYIGMSQLAGSKVGKQAAMDVIITIGQDDKIPNSRFLATPKNKIGNVHMKREVKFSPIYGRYEDAEKSS